MLVALCCITFRRPEGLGRLLDGLNQLTVHKNPEPEICVVVVDNDGAAPMRARIEARSAMSARAPDTVEVILNRRARSDVVLEKLERALPTEWKAQRLFWLSSPADKPSRVSGRSETDEEITTVHTAVF